MLTLFTIACRPAAGDGRHLHWGVLYLLQAGEARSPGYRCHSLFSLHPAEVKCFSLGRLGGFSCGRRAGPFSWTCCDCYSNSSSSSRLGISFSFSLDASSVFPSDPSSYSAGRQIQDWPSSASVLSGTLFCVFLTWPSILVSPFPLATFSPASARLIDTSQDFRSALPVWSGLLCDASPAAASFHASRAVLGTPAHAAELLQPAA